MALVKLTKFKGSGWWHGSWPLPSSQGGQGSMHYRIAPGSVSGWIVIVNGRPLAGCDKFKDARKVVDDHAASREGIPLHVRPLT